MAEAMSALVINGIIAGLVFMVSIIIYARNNLDFTMWLINKLEELAEKEEEGLEDESNRDQQ